MAELLAIISYLLTDVRPYILHQNGPHNQNTTIHNGNWNKSVTFKTQLSHPPHLHVANSVVFFLFLSVFIILC